MMLVKLDNPKRKITADKEEFHYSSITEFVQAINKGKDKPLGQSAWRNNDEWFGSDSIDEAFEILKGFNNKVQEIKTGLAALQGRVSEYVPEANRFSGSVNIGAMLSGVENCRVRVREKFVEQKSVTIYVQMNALSNISASNFVNKAIAIANLVTNLEKKGSRVEVIGYSYSKYTSKRGLVTIMIKPFGSMMSLGQLYGAFAPSTFRRLIFRHLELYWTHGISVPEGYGYSEDWNDNPKGTINIRRNSAFDTLEGAVNFVNYNLKQLKNEN